MTHSEALKILDEAFIELKAENERLETVLDIWQSAYASMEKRVRKLDEKLATAKAEAYKEFAERLKEDAQVYYEYDGEDEYFYMYVTIEDIDNLLKKRGATMHEILFCGKSETVDFKLCTACLLCGAPVPMVHLQDNSTKVCDDCKRLWKKLKEKKGGAKIESSFDEHSAQVV